MSVPAAKAFSPAPVMITALIPASASILPASVIRPSYIAKVRALRACGRFRTMRAMPAASWVNSSSSVAGAALIAGSFAVRLAGPRAGREGAGRALSRQGLAHDAARDQVVDGVLRVAGAAQDGAAVLAQERRRPVDPARGLRELHRQAERPHRADAGVVDLHHHLAGERLRIRVHGGHVEDGPGRHAAG